MNYFDSSVRVMEENERLKRENIKLRMGLEWMKSAFAEKRSDVVEICDSILAGETSDNFPKVESRYIQARLPDGVEVEYDTLTTMLGYHKYGEVWKQCDHHEYKED